MPQESPTNDDRPFRRSVDEFLSAAAPGLEEVVNSKSFGTMLAQTVSNAVALQRIGHDSLDLLLRNLRIAGRADVTSLHRQLARTEDKLELVLETVENLQEELASERLSKGKTGVRASDSPPRGRSGDAGD